MSSRPVPARHIPTAMLKAARTHWLTRAELAEAVGISGRTAWEAASDLVAEGFLLERDDPTVTYGRKLYKVAPQWIGGAQ